MTTFLRISEVHGTRRTQPRRHLRLDQAELVISAKGVKVGKRARPVADQMKLSAGSKNAAPPSSPWPPPSDPLAAVSARRCDERFASDGFAYWRGDFYTFSGTHWRNARP